MRCAFGCSKLREWRDKAYTSLKDFMNEHVVAPSQCVLGGSGDAWHYDQLYAGVALSLMGGAALLPRAQGHL